MKEAWGRKLELGGLLYRECVRFASGKTRNLYLRWGRQTLNPTYSLHCSSFLGLPFGFLNIELVKPKKGTTMETVGIPEKGPPCFSRLRRQLLPPPQSRTFLFACQGFGTARVKEGDRGKWLGCGTSVRFRPMSPSATLPLKNKTPNVEESKQICFLVS